MKIFLSFTPPPIINYFYSSKGYSISSNKMGVVNLGRLTSKKAAGIVL